MLIRFLDHSKYTVRRILGRFDNYVPVFGLWFFGLIGSLKYLILPPEGQLVPMSKNFTDLLRADGVIRIMGFVAVFSDG